MTLGIFREKQETARKHHHLYDDETIENMKQYFKVEHDYDALLKYIRGNRILHDSLAES
jgi:hypothetical protein